MSDDNGESKSLHEKIGFMRSDIKNIKEGLDKQGNQISQQVGKVFDRLSEIKSEVSDLKGSSVNHQQCVDRVQMITSELSKLTTEIAKKKTREDNPALSFLSAGYTEDIKPASKRGLLERVRENILFISALLGLIGLLSMGFYKMSHIVVRSENAIKATERLTQITEQLSRELKLDAGPINGGSSGNP